MKALQIYTVLGLLGLFSSGITGCTENAVSTSSKEKKMVVANTEAEYVVEGMHCQHGCAGTIEKSLISMSGIQDCSVNFDTKKAIVRFDKEMTSSEKIIAAIEALNDGQYKITNSEETMLQKGNINEEESSSNIEASINTSSSGFEVPDLFGFLQELF